MRISYHLSFLGWIAILGAILLILLADVTHFEELMDQVEWTTLVFFCGLFILMKVSLRLRLHQSKVSVFWRMRNMLEPDSFWFSRMNHGSG